MNPNISYFFDIADFPFKDIFDNCEFPWDLLLKIDGYLKNYSLGAIEGNVSPNAFLIDIDQISIGEGSIIEPGAYIKGPCLIGKNCVVRHGAYIRGQFIAGDNCVIGHDTEVKNSLFLNNTHAAHFAYVGDSVLGNDVNLGAGTKCANLKLDRSLVNVHFKDQFLKTKLKKFGAIIGDRTQIGCNTVTNPGAILGKDVNCYPCLNIGGFIPSKSFVKQEANLIITSY